MCRPGARSAFLGPSHTPGLAPGVDCLRGRPGLGIPTAMFPLQCRRRPVLLGRPVSPTSPPRGSPPRLHPTLACHQHPVCARPPCHQGSRRVGPPRCPRGNRAGRAEAGWGPLYLPQVQGDVDLVVLRAAGQRRALPPALRAVDGIARGVRPVAVGSRADVTVLALWGGGGQRAGPGWAPRLPHLTPPTPDLRTLARQSLLRSANLRRARLGTRHLWEAAAPIMEEASMGNRAPALGANSRARLPEEAAAEGCTVRGRALQVAGGGVLPEQRPWGRRSH